MQILQWIKDFFLKKESIQQEKKKEERLLKSYRWYDKNDFNLRHMFLEYGDKYLFLFRTSDRDYLIKSEVLIADQFHLLYFDGSTFAFNLDYKMTDRYDQDLLDVTKKLLNKLEKKSEKIAFIPQEQFALFNSERVKDLPSLIDNIHQQAEDTKILLFGDKFYGIKKIPGQKDKDVFPDSYESGLYKLTGADFDLTEDGEVEEKAKSKNRIVSRLLDGMEMAQGIDEQKFTINAMDVDKLISEQKTQELNTFDAYVIRITGVDRVYYTRYFPKLVRVIQKFYDENPEGKELNIKREAVNVEDWKDLDTCVLDMEVLLHNVQTAQKTSKKKREIVRCTPICSETPSS